MKRKIILIAVATLTLLITTALLFLQSQRQKNETILNLTTAQKLSDFEALCTILDESYPFWNEAEQAGIDKDSLYDMYRSNIEKTKTDIEFFKEMNYFLREFQGMGHLSVLDGYMYRLYTDTVSASEGMLTEKEAQAIEPLITVLTNPVCQNTYELLDQSHEGFRSTIGLKEEYQTASSTVDSEETPQLVTDILSGSNVAYLQIPTFELANYQRDQAVLTDFFAEIKDIPNLIIDLRGNGGGSDLYWEDLLVKPNAKKSLISERYYLLNMNQTTSGYVSASGFLLEPLASTKETFLSEYTGTFSHYITDTTTFETADNPYPGKIWLLVNEDVYSASENFAIFCKNTGFATVVGTTTGGDGGIADPMLFPLPNSGLIVRFSVFYGLNADGSGNEAIGTIPDIAVAETEDALDRCLTIITQGDTK